jgi:hypothetical protein
MLKGDRVESDFSVISSSSSSSPSSSSSAPGLPAAVKMAQISHMLAQQKAASAGKISFLPQAHIQNRKGFSPHRALSRQKDGETSSIGRREALTALIATVSVMSESHRAAAAKELREGEVGNFRVLCPVKDLCQCQGTRPTARPLAWQSVPLTYGMPPRKGNPYPDSIWPPHFLQVIYSDAEWKERLSTASYSVLRQGSTEMPFSSPLLKVRVGDLGMGQSVIKPSRFRQESQSITC